MRIRTIKPEFFNHEDLHDLEKEKRLPLRLAFIGLWCAADREGRFKWEPRRLGIQIMPYESLDFSRVLDALASRGYIIKYASGGRDYGWIPKFLKHQIINNREKSSDLPIPPHDVENQELDASSTREPRDEDADTGEGKGREGKGKEGKARSLRGTHDEVFEFCKAHGLFPRDAEYLWNKWEGNGWQNGGKSMKDWRATVRAWKAQGYLPSQKTPSASDVWPTPPVPEVEEEDLMAKMLRNKSAKEEARRIAEGLEPDEFQPAPKGELW